jgi:hypothetical protein
VQAWRWIADLAGMGRGSLPNAVILGKGGRAASASSISSPPIVMRSTMASTIARSAVR